MSGMVGPSEIVIGIRENMFMMSYMSRNENGSGVKI
jgi:hypothetical protein